MLMAIFAVSLASKSTSLSQMALTVSQGYSLLRPSLAFAFLAFILITLAETGRVPVDNPATHLELTMIHEAMLLEYSGRYLALVEWAKMMKLFLYVSLGTAAFAPWGIASNDDAGACWRPSARWRQARRGGRGAGAYRDGPGQDAHLPGDGVPGGARSSSPRSGCCRFHAGVIKESTKYQIRSNNQIRMTEMFGN